MLNIAVFTVTLMCGVLVNGSPMVARIGNEISRASLSGVDVPRATFLQKDIILTEGVVFAYSAYYRSAKPVRFQIWRPMAGAGVEGDTYRLIAQTSVLPAVLRAREDTYIESRLETEKCIRVKQNDRLGVYLEEAPGAVSYIFDASSPTALNHRLDNDTATYNSGDVYAFDALVFPYDFAVAAYIDVDPSHYANTDPDADFVDCHRGVLIPDYVDLGVMTTTTTPPPTGAPGATGPRGVMGATGPQGEAGEVGAPGAEGPMGVTGSMGATGATGSAGKDGADGSPGVNGVDGAAGPRGPKGEKGETGNMGPAGTPGKIIYVTNGSHPIEGLNPVLPGSRPSSIFTTETMSMSYLIWLIILSVAIVVLVIVIAIVATRKRHARDSSDEFGRARFPSTPSSRARFPSLPSSDTEKTPDTGEITWTDEMRAPPHDGQNGWMDTMKDETETTYSNDTLQREEDFTHGSSVLNVGYDNETKASELGY